MVAEARAPAARALAPPCGPAWKDERTVGATLRRVQLCTQLCTVAAMLSTAASLISSLNDDCVGAREAEPALCVCVGLNQAALESPDVFADAAGAGQGW
jgi:hypothetical protein